MVQSRAAGCDVDVRAVLSNITKALKNTPGVTFVVTASDRDHEHGTDALGPDLGSVINMALDAESCLHYTDHNSYLHSRRDQPGFQQRCRKAANTADTVLRKLRQCRNLQFAFCWQIDGETAVNLEYSDNYSIEDVRHELLTVLKWDLEHQMLT